MLSYSNYSLISVMMEGVLQRMADLDRDPAPKHDQAVDDSSVAESRRISFPGLSHLQAKTPPLLATR